MEFVEWFLLKPTSLGAILGTPETRRLLEQAMEEIAAVASANGVEVGGRAAVDTTLAVLASEARSDADITFSLQRDLLAGRPSELHWQVGVVSRLGEKEGACVGSSDANSCTDRHTNLLTRSQVELRVWRLQCMIFC